MADVFFSYAHEDRATVEALEGALRAHGWTTWFDRDIRPGQSFRKIIQQEIEAAAAVVVLWSVHSVDADWVDTEVAFAQRLGLLVPVAIDDCRWPFFYERLQTISLIGWNGSVQAPGYRQLVDEIMRRAPLGPRASAPVAGDALTINDPAALDKIAARVYRGPGKQGWKAPVLRTTTSAGGTLITWFPIVGATEYVVERAATPDFKRAEQIPCGKDLWYAPFQVPEDGLLPVSPAGAWRPSFYYRVKAVGDGLESDWSKPVKVP